MNCGLNIQAFFLLLDPCYVYVSFLLVVKSDLSELYERQDRPNYVLLTFDQDTLGWPARLTSLGTATVSSFLEQTWAGSSSLQLLDSSSSLGLEALASSSLLLVE